MTDRTHGPFKVNDVCVGQNFVHTPQCNGMECVVTEIVLETPVRGRSTGILYDAPVSYRVEWADGHKSRQRPQFLRLRPPKSDQSQWIREATTTWDQIQRETGWQPMRERV